MNGWHLKFGAVAVTVGLLGAGTATWAQASLQNATSTVAGSTASSTAATNSGLGQASSGVSLLDNGAGGNNKKKKKKKKKKTKQKRTNRQHRQQGQSERRQHREDQRRQTQLPKPEPKVQTRQTRMGETTTSRDQTETTKKPNEVKVNHDITSRETTSVEGTRTTKPPTSTSSTPVKIRVWNYDNEVKKFGTPEANVRLLGVDAASNLEMGPDKLAASASGGAFLVKAHAEKSFDLPVGDLKTEANASIGADAAANASLGTDGVRAGVDAFFGAKADTTFSYGVDGARAVVTAEAQYGVSAAADAGLQLVDNKLKIDYKLGAAFGLGGKLAGNLELDMATVSQAAQSIASGLTEAGTSVGGAIDDLTSAGGEVVKDIGTGLSNAGTAIAGAFDWG